MENDENLELELEQPIETTGTTEEIPVGTPDATEEPKKAETIKLTPAQFRHFKKWQEDQSRPAPKAETVPQPASSTSVEETILLSQDVPEELIEELKLRASKYGGSLIKAQKDPNYIAVKERFEKDQKQKEASLPASRGSGASKPKVDFNTPNLSRDQHKEMALKAMDNL